MPCIKFSTINVLQSDHLRVVIWHCRYFSTSKPPSERRQCCSDGTLFGGPAGNPENCRPGAVRGGGVVHCQWGFLEDSSEFVHLRRNWHTTKNIKYKSIWKGFILMLKINPLERIYFFGWKWNVFFITVYSKHRQLVQNLHTTNLREKKTSKNKPYGRAVSSGISLISNGHLVQRVLRSQCSLRILCLLCILQLGPVVRRNMVLNSFIKIVS